MKAKEQLGTGQVTAGGLELAGSGSGRAVESLREEVGFCGIVFLFAEEEAEEEEEVAGAGRLDLHSLELSGMIVGLKIWLLMARRVSFVWRK